METIHQTLVVATQVETAASSWPRFIESMLGGKERLACDQLMCVDAVSLGLVHFESAGEGRALVTFEVSAEQARATLGETHDADLMAAVDDTLRRDLLRFKDYIEGDACVGDDKGHGRRWGRRTRDPAVTGSSDPADPTRWS